MYTVERYLGIDKIYSLQVWYQEEMRLASLIKKRKGQTGVWGLYSWDRVLSEVF